MYIIFFYVAVIRADILLFELYVLQQRNSL